MESGPSEADVAVAELSDLGALAASSLTPLFWQPEGLDGAGRWWTHVPFAHWLVATLRPSVTLDLASAQNAISEAFCRAARRVAIDMRCYAPRPTNVLDGPTAVFLDLDAEEQIADGAVDLLYVDAGTDIAAARGAVKAWAPKLSDKAVVLIHGIAKAGVGFEHRRDWLTRAAGHPSFDVSADGELTLIAVGANVPPSVSALCALRPEEARRVRERLSVLGERWQHAADERRRGSEPDPRSADPAGEGASLRKELARWRAKSRDEQRAREQIAFRLAVARRDVYAANRRTAAAEAEVAAAREAAAAAETAIAQAEMAVASAEERAAASAGLAEAASNAGVLLTRDRDALLYSRTWIATRSLRRLAERHPGPARLAWRSARLMWWSVSLQLPTRYQAWRRRPEILALPSQSDGSAEGSGDDVQILSLSPPDLDQNSPPLTPEIGRAAGGAAELSHTEPSPSSDEEIETERAHRLSVDFLTFLAAEDRIDIALAAEPDLSVILYLPDEAASAFACLASLAREKTSVREVIVLRRPGDGVVDELLSRCCPIRILDVADDANPLKAFDQGCALAQGRTLLLLDGTSILRPGALAAGLAALDDDSTGAVGGRVVLPSRRLRGAGGIVWSDASLTRYAEAHEAEASEAMFRHAVDFSDLPLLLSRAVWREIEGFDTNFPALIYGLADLGMRLRATGSRVVHEPGFVSDVCFGPSLMGVSARAERELHASRARLRSRHDGVLRVEHLPKAEANLLPAREPRRTGRRRLLMIDNEVPFGSLGSGYPRAREMLSIAVAAGWAVTLFPLHRTDFDWVAARAEMPPEVEIIARRGAPHLAPFLEERAQFYDVILVSRPDNMELVRAAFRERPRARGGERIVYDAEAVFAYRELIRARLEGRPFTDEQIEHLCTSEAEQAAGVDGITCVSDAEAEFFRSRARAPVYVLNHPVVPLAAPLGFSSRTGFLFVGRLLEPAAPNWQGLSWFIAKCWPLVRAVLPDATLTVAGHVHPDHAALVAPGVSILGPVADLSPLYAAARVFVAPVRFAAGVPIKILEATAAGLPVAATRLMAKQLGWTSGNEIFAEDDPQELAERCVTLHEDAEIWVPMRAAATARLRTDFSPDQFRANLKAALDGRPPVNATSADDDARVTLDAAP